MTRDLGVTIITEFDSDEAERMRREDAAAVERLRQYIAEHRGNLLALELFLALTDRLGLMTGWNLPPGCTDADIDRAAQGDGSEYQCDCCGKMFPIDQLNFVPAGALGNSAGCDTSICPKCSGEEEEDDEQNA